MIIARIIGQLNNRTIIHKVNTGDWQVDDSKRIYPWIRRLSPKAIQRIKAIAVYLAKKKERIG